jgi:hypothetical protein
LLIATDSFDPDLGYAVPPGDRGIQVILDRITDYGHAVGRTPILPLTITYGTRSEAPHHDPRRRP